MINEKTKQFTLPFKVRSAIGRSNFIVGKSNYESVRWIDNWPEWDSNGLLIIGPSGSGKSHLASVWKNKSSAIKVNLSDKNSLKNDCNNLIIEDIHKLHEYYDLLHFINYANESGGKYLLTSIEHPLKLDIKPPDLVSRLLSLPIVQIKLPSDDVLYGLFTKLFLDRGLKVDEIVIKYIIKRMDRTYDNANYIVEKLDNKSLAENHSITIPLVREELNFND